MNFSSYKSADPQYFNSLTLAGLASGRACSYLDIGAYTGDSLHQLMAHVEVGQAVLIEPDRNNYLTLCSGLARLLPDNPNLRPLALPIGAGSEFNTFILSGNGEAASLSNLDPKWIQSVKSEPNAMPQTIVTVPLDFVMPVTSFDFIKIDVEGHDLAALSGIRSIVTRSRPVLAISLHHRLRDLFDLPLRLAEMLPSAGYHYHICQHMHNSFVSVLYAIPLS